MASQNVSMEEGCMIEPLSVGVQSVVKLAQLRPNQSIVILGAGPVGLLCMAGQSTPELPQANGPDQVYVQWR